MYLPVLCMETEFEYMPMLCTLRFHLNLVSTYLVDVLLEVSE